MNWINTLLLEPGLAHSLLVIALVVAIGILFSRIRFGKVSFGVTWILFVGILAGQLGLQVDPEISHFVKDFGLILFVYSVGIEVGPGFFRSFKQGGVLLNLLAVLLVLLGPAVMILILRLSNEDPSAMIGVLYGAVTNTPGLGAAQQTYQDVNNIASPLFAQGYAVAYPLAVVGIILSIIFLRCMFHDGDTAEQQRFEANADRNGLSLQRANAESDHERESAEPRIFHIFLGISLGVVLGVIPITIPGIPVPIRLGLAGGPLIVSIFLTHFGPRIHIPTHTSKSSNLMLRQIGICLFMAAVGIGAGQGFVQTLLGGGWVWVVYGFAITVVPCLVVGVVARKCFHLSTFTIAGLISGAMTDPPALAYSNSLSSSNQSSVAYSTVYPLVMFLRVLIAQVLVIVL